MRYCAISCALAMWTCVSNAAVAIDAEPAKASDSDLQPYHVIDVASQSGPRRVIVQLKDTQAYDTGLSKLNVDARTRARFAQQQSFVSVAKKQLPHMQFVDQLTSRHNAVVLELDADDIGRLMSFPQVSKIYPSYDLQVQATKSGKQIGADEVWDLNGSASNQGQGVTVAVLDTGINYQHPDLGGCLGDNCKVKRAENLLDDGDNISDVNGHGTAVASIVAASGELKGIAPQASLLSYKVCDASGSCPDFAVIKGIEKAMDPDGNPATDDAADIINISLGQALGGPDHPLSQAINTAADAGILVTVAAGKKGGSLLDVGVPANASGALTVGASVGYWGMYTDSAGGIVEQNGHLKPELVAPGVEIVVAQVGGGHVINSGSSYAAPMAAGAAALMLKAHPDMSVSQLRAALVTTTTDRDFTHYQEGSGFLNVLKAVKAETRLDTGLVNFGWRKDLSGSSAIRTITLQNKGSSAKNYQLFVNQLSTNPLDYSLSKSELTIAAGESASVDVMLNIPDDLAYKTAQDPAYIAKLNIVEGNNRFEIPVVLSHLSFVKVNFADFAQGFNTTEISVFDKSNGLVSRNSELALDESAVFAVEPGEYGVALTHFYQGRHEMAFKLGVNAGSSVEFSASDAPNTLQYQLVSGSGERLDNNGALPSGYSATVFGVLPEYKVKVQTKVYQRADQDTLATLHLPAPQEQWYFDAWVNNDDSEQRSQMQTLTDRIDLDSFNQAQSLVLNADASTASRFAFAMNNTVKQGEAAPISRSVVQSQTDNASVQGELLNGFTGAVHYREWLYNASGAQDFALAGQGWRVGNADDFGDAYTSADMHINPQGQLVLSSHVRTSPVMATRQANSIVNNIKLGFGLPAFRGVLTRNDGKVTLSYENANSTGFFADNWLTAYNGAVTTYKQASNASVVTSYQNQDLTLDSTLIGRPTHIELDENFSGVRMEFDAYHILGQSVALEAQLDFDLSKADFAPPQMTELTIATLGGSHTHLANGHGTISVTYQDESNLASNEIRYRLNGESKLDQSGRCD